MGHLLTAKNWAQYTRFVSRHVDNEEVEAFIDECEQLFIIPAIGAETFLALCGEKLTEEQTLLLEGGQYVGKSKEKRIFKGLRSALAYFVYAKMAKNDGAMVGRSGFLQHDDEHASRMDDKNRVNKYNDLMNVAEHYLSGAMKYLSTWNKKDEVKPVRGSRVRIIEVGE